MNNDEMAALAAGLGKAIVDGLAANEAAREEHTAAIKRERLEAEEAEEVVERRLRALNEVVRSFERKRRSRISNVSNAIGGYCYEAQCAVLESLKNDPRMPRSVNYLERYGLLMRMQDRGEVLRRIESTLDLADRILDSVEAIDVKGALTEAAGAYAGRVMGLDGIRVCEPGGLSDPDFIDDEPPTVDYADFDMEELIGEAFSEAWGAQTALEDEKTRELMSARAREKVVDEQVDRAKKMATKAAQAACRRRARSVAGSVLAIEQPADFSGSVGAKLVNDPALVCALAAEVRRSFATFTQVVQDNGLFAAFSNETSYGACRGYRFNWWWSDLFYDECEDEYYGDAPGQQKYDDIPTAVKEDAGGDSLEKTVERMRVFNKQRYWGLLDDDFQEHVEAFWYGFKKLMENVNGLFEVDTRAFSKYCSRMSSQVKEGAADLAARMDDVQETAFIKEVSARAQKEAGE